MIVVDASVLLDMLLRRPDTLTGVEDAMSGRADEPLRAPEVIEPETLNALRRLLRTGEVDMRRATEAVAGLARVRLVRYPHAPLRARVWALRDALSAYDAAYLALAEALGDAMLLTADRGLFAAGGRALGPTRVRLLA